MYNCEFKPYVPRATMYNFVNIYKLAKYTNNKFK